MKEETERECTAEKEENLLRFIVYCDFKYIYCIGLKIICVDENYTHGVAVYRGSYICTTFWVKLINIVLMDVLSELMIHKSFDYNW